MRDKMKKPTIRWTVGPFSELSMDVLRISINNTRRLYGDRFFLTVTYNNVPESELQSLPIDLSVDQSKLTNELPIKPPSDPLIGMAWKLYPPRTNLESHEIMLDNDVIIFRKLEAIERFLQSESLILITEGLMRSYSPDHSNKIRNNFNINSGFVCLPPMFDYKSEIISAMHNHKEWGDRFDEQSVVAIALQSKNIEIIPMSDISIVGPMTSYKVGRCGIHFIGINGGYDTHWARFSNIKHQ